MMTAPTNSMTPVWIGRIAMIALLMGIGLSVARAADPDLILGPNACAECHKKEAAIWQKTHHFTTFRDLPNNKDADTIATKMGVKRLKSESLCLNCHFTVQAPDKVIAGISCKCVIPVPRTGSRSTPNSAARRKVRKQRPRSPRAGRNPKRQE